MGNDFIYLYLKSALVNNISVYVFNQIQILFIGNMYFI